MCFKLQKCEIWPFRPSKIETRTEFSVEEKKESTIFQLGFHRSTYKKRKKENEEEEKHFSDWVFISVPAIPERDRSDAGKVALLFLSLAAKYRNNFYYYLRV